MLIMRLLILVGFQKCEVPEMLTGPLMSVSVL